ncbi:molybdate ABC transporter substrate-binding protein [Salipaludibacillus sp. CF4.18]|uniref:molybdate ABC transporter substrate-binding protein n=1 Tax=Salipaludibacillus sp. CF4.18 TaxID=3373081 RepID=UPI003EE44A77
MRKWNCFYILLLLIISGCGQNDDPASNSDNKLTVAAAADLVPAFNDIGEKFTEKTGTEITFSFHSTGQLADQIENGAPFDVFAAANVSFIDRLREAGFIVEGTQATYAYGKLGLTTLKDSGIKLDSLEDLKAEEIVNISIANPEHAPYGMAAKEILENAGVWGEVKDKVVYGRNISDALVQVETGNAEVGLIAHSLAMSQEDTFDFLYIDEELYEPLEQSIAIIEGSDQEELAKVFMAFVLEAEGKDILESHGFETPEGE